MNHKPNEKQIGLLCYLLKSTGIERDIWDDVIGGVQQAGIRAMQFSKDVGYDDFSDLVDCLKTYERTQSKPEHEYIVNKIKKLTT